jgi:hypothetical protein
MTISVAEIREMEKLAIVGAPTTGVGGYLAGRTARQPQRPMNKYARAKLAHALPTNENVVVPRVLAAPDDIDGDHRSWASPGDPDHLPAENRPTCAALSADAEANAQQATEGELKRYLAMGKRPLRREPNTDLQFLIRESTKQKTAMVKTASDAGAAAGIGAATGGLAGGGAGLMAGYNAAKSKTPKPSWITRKLNPEGSLIPTPKDVTRLRKAMTRGGLAGAATGVGLGALAGLGAHLALREKRASFDPTAAHFRHVERNLQRTFLR